MSSIKFGTDGWRAILGQDFNERNARIVAMAIARYVVRGEDAGKGVLVGYDHRFESEKVAAAAAEVISSTGTPVWLADKPCPTPAISLLVRRQQAAGGVVITASHNPSSWNGIKYKASYGSSALPAIVAQIEKELETVLAGSTPELPPRKALIHALEPRAPYLDTIEKLVDWQRLRDAKFRFVVDPMHGSAAGLLLELFERNGVACDEIRGTRDPQFGGVHPEPIEPQGASREPQAEAPLWWRSPKSGALLRQIWSLGRSASAADVLRALKMSSLDPYLLAAAADCGVSDFGESYLQEALDKIAGLQERALTWHFIGRVQANKTRPIAQHFAWVHAVDRLKVAERLSAQRPPGPRGCRVRGREGD